MDAHDLHSERNARVTAEASGEAALDGAGHAPCGATRLSRIPAIARAARHLEGRCHRPDGQTLTGERRRTSRWRRYCWGKAGRSKEGEIEFLWDAEEEFAKTPEAVNVKLYRVQTKSVKERLAPDVYRYRNFDQYGLLRNASG
jgi:hypothetical protein